MKLLLDQNLSHRLLRDLAPHFAEVSHVRAFGLSNASDLIIWNFALTGGWAVVSKDGDFADLALLRGAPPKVIRLRIGNSSWRKPGQILLENLDPIRVFLEDPEVSLLLLS